MPAAESAHRDRFVLERMPPKALRPSKRFKLPELLLPERLNAGAALLTESGVEKPRATACLDARTRWSYGELEAVVARVAAWLLREAGLVPGNRVLLRLHNSPMLMAALLGVFRAGCIAVPTLPLLRAGELAPVLGVARPDLALCAGELTEPLVAARRDARLDFPLHAIEPLAEASETQPRTLDPVATAAEDPALILFTSGTTGRPKAAMHTHGDILAIARSFGRHIFRGREGDVVIGTPSLAFAYGFGMLLAFPLAAGAAVCLPERVTPERLLEMANAFGATMLATVPTGYRRLVAGAETLSFERLRRCFSAGEHLPRATFEAWRARTGLPIINLLGSTELLGPYVSAPEETLRPGTLGRAVPGFEIETRPAGERPEGSAGRLAVRGPTGCCYLDSRDQAGAVHDGWTLTGDVCRIDAEGYVHFEGRADDMILSSGYTISALEIEEALATHDAVAECAVIGLDDDERGQVVAAAVVTVPGRAGNEALADVLIAHVKALLAPYKAPRRVIFAEALPKTPSGKIRRQALRSAFA